jgi:hypothetical protein
VSIDELRTSSSSRIVVVETYNDKEKRWELTSGDGWTAESSARAELKAAARKDGSRPYRVSVIERKPEEEKS